MIELSGTQIYEDGSTNTFKYKFPKEGGIKEGPSEVSPEDTLRFAVLVEPGRNQLNTRL